MKFIALTFDYNISNLKSIGRKWAPNIYREKDFIFEYSAASYASFIYWNPDQIFEIYTDDVDVLKNKLDKYDVCLKNVFIIDWSQELEIYKNHKYSFEPIIQLVKKYKNSNEYIVKLDNDLVCKKKFEIKNENSVLLWKYERVVTEGNPLWGEKLACQQSIGTTDFKIYNIGVMGIPIGFWKHYEEFENVCNSMINVDISGVTDVGSKIYHCCEQTAYNWIFEKYNFNILETYDIFDHHFEIKANCIEHAKKYLVNKQGT